MREGAIEWHERDGGIVLRPTRGIDRSHVRSLWRDANRVLKGRAPSRLILDLRDLSRIDGAGVAFLRELEHRCRTTGVQFSAEGAAPAVSDYLEFVRGRSPEKPRRAPARRPAARALISEKIATWSRTLRALLEFVGRFAESVAALATHPRKLRLREVVYQIQRSGAEGMWLLGALSLLLGIIMAFQGISRVKGFGSPILVADVVTFSTTQQMAPLLTGVLMAGRSGAAIAAEIGTMKINQELDALSVMGLDVVPFLLVPRTLALVISTPLLTVLAAGVAILGGALVAMVVLNLPLVSYFSEVQRALSGTAIVSALAKAMTFGFLIGVMACFQGLQVLKAAEDVGKQATAAVVRSILLIILADAFFSIVAEVYGW